MMENYSNFKPNDFNVSDDGFRYLVPYQWGHPEFKEKLKEFHRWIAQTGYNSFPVAGFHNEYVITECDRELHERLFPEYHIPKDLNIESDF